jgi:hypothetical protein
MDSEGRKQGDEAVKEHSRMGDEIKCVTTRNYALFEMGLSTKHFARFLATAHH